MIMLGIEGSTEDLGGVGKMMRQRPMDMEIEAATDSTSTAHIHPTTLPLRVNSQLSNNPNHPNEPPPSLHLDNPLNLSLDLPVNNDEPYQGGINTTGLGGIGGLGLWISSTTLSISAREVSYITHT